MSYRRCFVCLSQIIHPGTKRSGEGEPVQSTSRLEEQLDAIFILKHILELNSELLGYYVRRCGNPGEWVHLCDQCNGTIHQIRDVFSKLQKISREFEKQKWVVQENIRKSEEKIEETMLATPSPFGKRTGRKRKTMDEPEFENNEIFGLRKMFCCRVRVEPSSRIKFYQEGDLRATKLAHKICGLSDKAVKIVNQRMATTVAVKGRGRRKKLKNTASDQNLTKAPGTLPINRNGEISDTVQKWFHATNQSSIVVQNTGEDNPLVKKEPQFDLNPSSPLVEAFDPPSPTWSIENFPSPTIDDHYAHGVSVPAVSEETQGSDEASITIPRKRSCRTSKTVAYYEPDPDADVDLHNNDDDVRVGNPKTFKAKDKGNKIVERKKNPRPVPAPTSHLKKSKTRGKRTSPLKRKTSLPQSGKKINTTCRVCSMKFKTGADLENHLREAHKLLNCKEPECRFKCFKYWIMYQHVAQKHGSNMVNASTSNRRMKKNLGDRIYRKICEECGLVLSSREKLKEHGKKVHKVTSRVKKTKNASSRSLSCPTEGCTSKFRSKWKLYFHKLLCHSHRARNKDKSCRICGRRFWLPNALKRHYNVCVKSIVKCFACDISFPSRKQLNLHVQNMHKRAKQRKSDKGPPKRRTYTPKYNVPYFSRHQCPLCPKSLCNRRELLGHIRRVHEGLDRTKCEFCLKVVTRQHYKEHLASHHYIGDFKCDVENCGKVFINRRYLQIHMFQKHGLTVEISDIPNGDKPIHGKRKSRLTPKIEHDYEKTCKICNKIFANKGIRDDHVRRFHMGRYAKKCNICGKILTDNAKLKLHLARVHKKGDFACHMCPKIYGNKRDLNRHLMYKHGIDNTEVYVARKKPGPPKNINGFAYKHRETTCEMCGRKLSSIPSLQKHLARKHGIGDYICDICGGVYPTPGLLKRHVAWKHIDGKPKGKSKKDKDEEEGLKNTNKNQYEGAQETIEDEQQISMLQPQEIMKTELITDLAYSDNAVVPGPSHMSFMSY